MNTNNTDISKVFASFFEKILNSLEDSPSKARVSKRWSVFSSLLNSTLDEKVLYDYIESMDDVSKELYFLQICQSNPPLISDNTRSTFLTNEECKRIEPIYESQYEENWHKEDSFIINRDRIMSNEEEKRLNNFKAPSNSKFKYNLRPRGNTSDRLSIKNNGTDRFSITRLSYEEPINQKTIQPKNFHKIKVNENIQSEKLSIGDILKDTTNFVSELKRNSQTLKELHLTLSEKVPEKNIYKKPIKSRQAAHNQYVNQMVDHYLNQQKQIPMGTPMNNIQMVNQFQGQNPIMMGNQNQLNSFNNPLFFQNQVRRI